MAEIPEWFPRTIEELHRPDRGDPPSLTDPRVATSHGGGVCPVQHWGVLIDGRVFYFRYRHGYATVTLAPDWFEPGDLPTMDPRVSMEEWEAIYYKELERVNGVFEDFNDAVLPRLWIGNVGGYQVTKENDGWFSSQDQLDEAFTRCLDEVWSEPLDEEGWAAVRADMLTRADKYAVVDDDLDDLFDDKEA